MNEFLNGTPEGNNIFGYGGNDTLMGRDGDDRLIGGEGDDILRGGRGDDILIAGNGEDTLRGGAGHDSLYGGQGDDTMFGDGGQDFLSGGVGDDVLYGNFANDELRGDQGNDTLDGGEGNDTLTGGGGSDRFDFVAVDQGKDLVTDFAPSLDTINLSSIFAGAGYDSTTPFADYVELVDGTDSTFGVSGTAINVDPDGDAGNAAFVTVAFLDGVASENLSETNFLV
jgi:Ca2+-binding RTX toxin-like protein